MKFNTGFYGRFYGADTLKEEISTNQSEFNFKGVHSNKELSIDEYAKSLPV